METEFLQPVCGYTTIRRTFCIGGLSRHQYQQRIRGSQGCCGIVLSVQFLAIGLYL